MTVRIYVSRDASAQALGADESFGFNDPNEEPDFAAARDSIGVVATMFQPRTMAAG